MKKLARFISVLLSIALLAVSVPITALPQRQDDRDLQLDESASEIVIGQPGTYSSDSLDPEALKVMGKGEKTLKELQEIDISKIDFPKFISKEKAVNRGHANRLHEQERNLNTVIYQNRDGSKTAYIFTKPVKYVDSDGNIKDKNTNIVNCQYDVYSYAMLDNSVKVYFPTNITNGILMNFNGHNVKMLPVVEKLTSPNNVRILNGTAYYSEVFGAKIDLQYTTLLNGIKEDIVIKEYDGQSSFDFILETNGLIARKNEQGLWQLIDGENTIYTFEKILIRDSSGKTIFGDMNIYSTDDGTTKLNIEVPTQFLLDDNTQYPVYVDPTAYIWETTMDDTEGELPAIIDVGLYASENDYLDANGSAVLHLGTYNEGISKVIYKFPDFYNAKYGAYMFLNSYNIGSAKLYVNFLSATTSTVVNAYPMTDTYLAVTDPTHLYDIGLINAYATANSSSTSISSIGEVQIDITDIVKGWAKYNSGDSTQSYNNPANGMMLSLDNSGGLATVESTEYDVASNVYLELDYSSHGGEHFIYSLTEYNFISRSTSTSLSLNTYNTSNTHKWIVEYLGDDEFYIRSAADANYYLYGSGSSVSLSTLPASPSNNYKWNISLATGGGVVIKNLASNYLLHINGNSLNLISSPATNSSAYALCRWGILSFKDYIEITDITLSDDWIKHGTTKYLNIKATPSNANWKSNDFFTWSLSNTSIIDFSDDVGKFTGISAGKVTLTLTNKLSGFSKSFIIACGIIREDIYMLNNKGTGRYMEVENSSSVSGAYIQQGDYHTNDYAKWNVILLDNGDYVIQSVYSDKYLRVINGSVSSGAKIIQYDNYNYTSCRWKIEETTSGAYRLTPMMKLDFAVSVPLTTNANGTDLIQLAYTNDANYYDEWLFDNIGQTHGITDGSVYNIQAVHSSQVINVKDGESVNGTQITQEPYTNAYQWQRWQINYIGNGEYKIKDVNSGNLLSITASSSSLGKYAQLWVDDGTSGQIFKIKENADGTYSFLSKCSNYLYALTIVGASTTAGTRLYQYSNSGANNQKFTLRESNKAIIIVPGILGSELYLGTANDYFLPGMPVASEEMFSIIKQANTDNTINDNISSDNISFVANPNDSILKLYLGLYSSLMCEDDGSSKYDIYVKEYRKNITSDTISNQCGLGNLYGFLYNKLETAFSNEYVIDFFSYDWRLSNAISATKLNNYINHYMYEDVIFVAHSMGGLVVSGYMGLGNSQRNNTDQIYYLASPLLGAPAVANVWYNEDISFISEPISNMFGIDIEDFNSLYKPLTDVLDPVQHLISNYVSVYELFPSEYFFNLVGDSYMSKTFTGIVVGGSYSEAECDTYASTKELLVEHFNDFDEQLMGIAEEFHDSIFISGTHSSAYADSYYYYCVSRPTTSHVEFSRTVAGSTITELISVDGIGDGDSLVLKSSATLANIYPSFTEEFNGNHMSLINASQPITTLIDNIKLTH